MGRVDCFIEDSCPRERNKPSGDSMELVYQISQECQTFLGCGKAPAEALQVQTNAMVRKKMMWVAFIGHLVPSRPLVVEVWPPFRQCELGLERPPLALSPHAPICNRYDKSNEQGRG